MAGNRRVIFSGPGEVKLEECPLPEIGAGSLLVRTDYSSISTGTELTLLSGSYPPGSYWAAYGRYPFVAGYSNVGTVIEAGEGVEEEWIGLRVASYAAHARYNVVPLEEARVIPAGVDPEEATLFTLAEIVMNGLRKGRLRWGERVAVFGLGLLGQLAVRLCCFCGVEKVFGIDTAEQRLKYLPPEAVAVKAGEEDAEKVIRQHTGGDMADIVFELTGDPQVLIQEPKALHPQGRLVVLSSPRGISAFDFHDLCNYPSLQIIGAHNSSHPQQATFENPWTRRRHDELFFELLAGGRLSVADLITHRVPYSEVCSVYMYLLMDRSVFMAVVIQWQGTD
ncbi:MAG: zinc-binding alcohol dehydrogenase [bacterium]|nr:zinc-binding alcohol dehydrogenase [bacterium]